MSKVKARAIVPVGEFIERVMNDKKIKGVELSDKTGISRQDISQFRKQTKNPHFEKIEFLLNTMDEELVILDSKGSVYNLPNTIVTPTQLHKEIGAFYFKLKNGDIYGIETINSRESDFK